MFPKARSFYELPVGYQTGGTRKYKPVTSDYMTREEPSQ